MNALHRHNIETKTHDTKKTIERGKLDMMLCLVSDIALGLFLLLHAHVCYLKEVLVIFLLVIL